MNQELKDFIKSDLNEAEFYGVSRDNSITLEEYLEKMKDLDFQFQQMAQFEIFSIKRKCNWVDEVWFAGVQNHRGKYELKGIAVFAKDGRGIFGCPNKDGEYGCIVEGLPRIFLLHHGIRKDLKRLQEFYKIQEELNEIDSIGSEVYNGYLSMKPSVSNNFGAKYHPDLGLYVNSVYGDLATFTKPRMKDYHNPILKNDMDKAKVLQKILIKNN